MGFFSGTRRANIVMQPVGGQKSKQNRREPTRKDPARRDLPQCLPESSSRLTLVFAWTQPRIVSDRAGIFCANHALLDHDRPRSQLALNIPSPVPGSPQKPDAVG
jgi:hypothetical protein